MKTVGVRGVPDKPLLGLLCRGGIWTACVPSAYYFNLMTWAHET